MGGAWLAGLGDGTVSVAGPWFDDEFLQRARSYHDVRYALAVLRIALTLGAAWWLALAPPRPLRRLLDRWPGWRGRLAGVTAVVLVLTLVRLPVGVAAFLHARAYGLRTDGTADYLLDVAKAVPVSWITVAAVALPVLALFARKPGWWPLPATGIVAVLAAVYAFGAPLVVDPLFHRIRPLQDTPLRAEILELCRRGGAPVADVHVADASRRTRAVNAYFTGLGPSRRIVLYDTLLETLDDAGALRVVAHEVGHWRHAHVRRGLLLGLAAAAAGFVLLDRVLGAWVRRRGGGDRAHPRVVLPAYAMYVTAMVLALPAVNAVSRSFEREADRTALELTGDPDGFVANRVAIARRNLSDVDPPRWVTLVFYTHPPTRERIAAAEAWR